MSNVALASINTFGRASPEAVSPILEIQAILKDCVSLYNQVAEIVRDAGILRGRELAEMTTRANNSLLEAGSTSEKILLINAYARQLFKKIAAALKTTSSPEKKGIIRQAITMIQLRAVAIIDHVRTLAEGKEKIALDSSQARQYLAGREGKPPSRRDAIRALRRAEKICPALKCGYTPNDGRQTMRVIAKTEDLKDSHIVEESRNSDQRQRSPQRKSSLG